MKSSSNKVANIRNQSLSRLWPKLTEVKSTEEKEQDMEQRLKQLNINNIRANKVMAIANKNRSSQRIMKDPEMIKKKETSSASALEDQE